MVFISLKLIVFEILSDFFFIFAALFLLSSINMDWSYILVNYKFFCEFQLYLTLYGLCY